jgi:hypothetical protein
VSRNSKRHPEPLELFLDDGFSNPEVAAILRAAGFVVHEFTECFPREDDPAKREQGIVDPPVIKLCHERRWVMITTDKDMCRKHLRCLRRHKQAMVVATAHNGHCLPDEWARGLILFEPILREIHEWKRRPWFVFFNRQGEQTSDRDHIL